MVRLPGWERSLSDYLAEMRGAPFQWGINDCILFAVKGVERMTGVKVYDGYLGYVDQAGANTILDAEGGFEALIAKHFGAGHGNILQAKRGDLVILKIPNYTCGLVDDSGQSIVITGPNGVVRYPLKKAWRVFAI